MNGHKGKGDNLYPGPRAEPLLKWPGGKRELLSSIRPLVPESFGCYYEPFVGGGALFFDLRPRRAVISDHNSDLIECYTEVRDNPHGVVDALADLPNTLADYYRVRASTPDSPTSRAARLIYLVTLSFNGIYRVNLRGQFNVPYGYKTYLQVADRQRITAASAVLAGAKLRDWDFERSVASAKMGDFVYMDPPYTVEHARNGFLKYNARIFSWDDQTRLALVARDLSERGCHVLVSNADHESVEKLYPDFQTFVVSRPSRIAASSEHRGCVTECLFYKEPA